MDNPEQIAIENVTLTSPAAKVVRDLMAKQNLQDYALRLFVQGGGCSGFQYGLALDSNIRESDMVSETDGIKLLVDEVSILYLRGATVDYIDGPTGSGFKIQNPNPIASCGCGQSSGSSNGGNGGCSGCG
jgi:iron-sulfur cluster assembly protein